MIILSQVPLFFSTHFSPQYSEIIKIVKKYLPVLHVDETLSQVLETPVKFGARRACTIGNMVSPSLFPRNPDKRSTWLRTKSFFRCVLVKYRACSFASVTKTFRSFRNPELLADYINCNSRSIVYLINCQLCNLHRDNKKKQKQKQCVHAGAYCFFFCM